MLGPGKPSAPGVNGTEGIPGPGVPRSMVVRLLPSSLLSIRSYFPLDSPALLTEPVSLVPWPELGLSFGPQDSDLGRLAISVRVAPSGQDLVLRPVILLPA